MPYSRCNSGHFHQHQLWNDQKMRFLQASLAYCHHKTPRWRSSNLLFRFQRGILSAKLESMGVHPAWLSGSRVSMCLHTICVKLMTYISKEVESYTEVSLGFVLDTTFFLAMVNGQSDALKQLSHDHRRQKNWRPTQKLSSRSMDPSLSYTNLSTKDFHKYGVPLFPTTFLFY